MKCKFSILCPLILLISSQTDLSFSQTWSWTEVDTMFNRTGVYPTWKSAPAFTDFEGDGDYDLALGCGNGTIQYYENIGDSLHYEWRQNNRIFEGVTLEDSVFVAFADLNGTGVRDLVISCNTFNRPSIEYLINLGSPEDPLWFYDVSIFAEIDSFIYDPTFADYDRDGDLDMGVLSYFCNFTFYENIGSASGPIWQVNSSYFPDMEAPMGVGPFDVYILDIDSDGDCDILATQWVWDDGFAVYGYKNIGSLEDPVWQLIDFLIPAWYYMIFSELAFADLDADGDEDLLMGFLEPNLYLYENLGSAQDMVFDEEHPEIWGNIWVYRCESVQAFDFDGDGDNDLTSTGNVSFWPEFYDYGYLRSWANVGNPYNCGLRESSWVRSSFWLTGHWRLTSGDLNADDRVDLALSWKALASPDTSLLAYVNLYESGLPEWEQDTTVFSYFHNSECDSDPELADLDNDGDMDLFVYTAGQFHFYENVGGPSSPDWSERPSWLEGLDDVSHAGRFSDLDRDGRPDLVLLASQGLKAYMNTGSLGQPSWTFTPEVFEDLDTLKFSYFDFSDLDGDGDEDLLGGTDGFVFYYENASVTSVEGGSIADAVLSQFFHLSCYPNPFNNLTEIMFVVPRESRVTLTVYNLLGRVIARPLDDRLPAGMHSFLWDAEGLSSGLYFYRLSTGESSDTRKMTILK